MTFGFAARIATAKGVMPLIEAFAAGVAMTTSIRLDIAGEGPLLKSLKRRADQLKVASYVNYNGVYMSVDERSDFMRGIDVFVLPSSSEGTPNGIMEAMAHGLPIIATRVGGIPDMVDSSSAILVEPDDTAALSAAIVRLAGDPELRAGMGAAARKRYEQMFSPEAVMPLLLETYRSVVSGKEQRMLSQPRIHPWAKFAAVPACDMTVKQSS